MSEIHTLVNESMGSYIPRQFAWLISGVWDNIDPEDIKICKTGPGHPEYWEAWGNILGSAKFTDSEGNVWYLQQEGDLLAYTGDGEEFV